MTNDYKLKDVFDFAVDFHAYQERRCSGAPFINHPIMVYEMIKNWGVTEKDVLAAALLHDVIEDTTANIEAVLSLTNRNVANIVSELTLTDGCSNKKAMQIAEFSDIEKKSVQAVVIKAADRICNVYEFAEAMQPNAVDYLKKGSPIFLGFIRRKREIAHTFGERVYDAGYETYTHLAGPFMDSFRSFCDNCALFTGTYFTYRNGDSVKPLDFL